MKHNRLEYKTNQYLKSITSYISSDNYKVARRIYANEVDLILFENIEYITPTNERKYTEMGLYGRRGKIDIRIECKSQISISDLDARLLKEIELAKYSNMPEKEYYIIIGGKGFTNNPLIKKLANNLIKGSPIKITIGTIYEFKTYVNQLLIKE